jgi:hypothetical protein
MQRLFTVFMAQPDLLLEHANAYAALVSDDIKSASTAGKQSAVWGAALLCCVGVAAVLAGGALMIWATVAENAIRLPWVLLATPIAPLIAAAFCFKKFRPQSDAPAFAKLRHQIAADMQMLQEIHSK